MCKILFETVPQSLRISLVFSHNVGIMIAFGLLKQEIIVIDCSPVSATITSSVLYRANIQLMGFPSSSKNFSYCNYATD